MCRTRHMQENESKKDHLRNCENGRNVRDLQQRQDYPDRKELRILKRSSGQNQKNTGQDGSKGRLYRRHWTVNFLNFFS